MARFTPDEPLAHLLSYFGRLSFRSCRRAEVFSGGKVDHATGLPLSANDLAPEYVAVNGRKLALTSVVNLRSLASSTFMRVTTTPEGEQEHVALNRISPSEWTPQELEMVDEWEFRFQRAALLATRERGWFNLAPLDPLYQEFVPENGKLSHEASELPSEIGIRMAGLEAAREWLRDSRTDPKWKTDLPLGHGLSSEDLRNAPQWAKDAGLILSPGQKERA